MDIRSLKTAQVKRETIASVSSVSLQLPPGLDEVTIVSNGAWKYAAESGLTPTNYVEIDADYQFVVKLGGVAGYPAVYVVTTIINQSFSFIGGGCG